MDGWSADEAGRQDRAEQGKDGRATWGWARPSREEAAVQPRTAQEPARNAPEGLTPGNDDRRELVGGRSLETEFDGAHGRTDAWCEWLGLPVRLPHRPMRRAWLSTALSGRPSAAAIRRAVVLPVWICGYCSRRYASSTADHACQPAVRSPRPMRFARAMTLLRVRSRKCAISRAVVLPARTSGYLARRNSISSTDHGPTIRLFCGAERSVLTSGGIETFLRLSPSPPAKRRWGFFLPGGKLGSAALLASAGRRSAGRAAVGSVRVQGAAERSPKRDVHELLTRREFARHGARRGGRHHSGPGSEIRSKRGTTRSDPSS